MALPFVEKTEVPEGDHPSQTPRVAIIGAGPGGLCMAVGLRRLGVSDFTIFEQSDGIGGTWWDNVYPGAAVDTPVPFYSFSFHSYNFTRTHVEQPELLRYLENLSGRFQLDDHIRLKTAVEKVVWDDSAHSYDVFTSDGVRQQFDVVVSAVGLLNHPRYPDWPGLEKFRGPKFHSARWDKSVDVTGKRVAVVGTGSTSAQLVPAIASLVSQLHVFQRQPGWILPKGDRDFTPQERASISQPWRWYWERAKQHAKYEKASKSAKLEGSKVHAKSQDACEKYIATVFKDRPDLQKMVTPDYPFGVKRPVKDSNFYPALLRDNVELVPHAVTEVTETGIIDETGYEREVDVLIMCTGFQPANFLATYEVVGRDGKTIHEVWNGEPQAYLGLTVGGFPNFYMLYGPNTNGAPIMYMLERQVAFVMSNIRRMIKDGVTAIEVRQSVMDVFNRILQKRLAKTVANQHPEVRNYSRSASGRNVIGWADHLAVYSFLTRTTPRLSSVARRLSTERKPRSKRSRN